MAWSFFLYPLYLIIFAGVVLKIFVTVTMGRYKIKKSLKGKVVVITGGTAGIGRETVKELARNGATVHVLARDMSKAERVIGEIKKITGNTDVHIHNVDLSDFSSVRSFAKRFLDTESRIDILINNAGLANGVKRVTIDGNEETTQANHLSHFLLTHLLLDRIIESAPSRIVNVSSIAHRFIRPKVFDVHDINFEKSSNKWDGFKAYCWTKLMNVLFTRELARRLQGKGVTVNCLHPGGVRTELTRAGNWRSPLVLSIWFCGPFLKTAYEGAQSTLYLAASEQVENVNGHYFADCKLSNISLMAADDHLAAALWKESERLTKITKS